jgi:hypothetical protein
MIFRLTQKAAKRLHVRCEEVPLGQVSMLEWYCNVVIVHRRHFFLFTQAKTLFSFWSPAAGCTQEDFGPMFRRQVSDTLRDYGFSRTDIAKIVDDGPDIFSMSADRGVVGSMVDYAKMIQYVADYEGGLDRMSQRMMNDIANDCPMSRIGGTSPERCLKEVLHSEGAA